MLPLSNEHFAQLLEGSNESILPMSEADNLLDLNQFGRGYPMTDTQPDHNQLKRQTLSGNEVSHILARSHRRKVSVEQTLIEICLAGISARRVESLTKALWGTKMSLGIISDLNKKVYSNIEQWRNRTLQGECPYVYLDGMVGRRSWGGEVTDVPLLVAIGVNSQGYRQTLAICERTHADKDVWLTFLLHLKERGLTGVRLFITPPYAELVKTLGDLFPQSKWQCCALRFYRNVFSLTPTDLVPEVAAMLKAIHASESRKAAMEKAEAVQDKLEAMTLKEAAREIHEAIPATLTYYEFPRRHRSRIRTNNALERIVIEMRHTIRSFGTFPDGHSALMLCSARLRHIAETEWGTKRYLNIDLLN